MLRQATCCSCWVTLDQQRFLGTCKEASLSVSKPACQSQSYASRSQSRACRNLHRPWSPHTRFTPTWECQRQVPAQRPARCDPSSWPGPRGCCRACRTMHAGPPIPGAAGCAPVGWVKETRKHRVIPAGRCNTVHAGPAAQAPLGLHLRGGGFKQAGKHRVVQVGDCETAQFGPSSNPRRRWRLCSEGVGHSSRQGDTRLLGQTVAVLRR